MSAESSSQPRVLRVADSAAEIRCPYCHDDDVPDAAGWKRLPRATRERFRYCAACRAVHHAECWSEGGGCSACGRHFDAIPTPPVPRPARPAPSVETVVAAAEEWRATQPERTPARRQLAGIVDAHRPAPAAFSRRRLLSVGLRLAAGGLLAYGLLLVVGTGVVYNHCLRERAAIEHEADTGLVRVVDRWDDFQFGAPEGHQGRLERVDVGVREVAERRAAALAALSTEYGGLPGSPGELPLFPRFYQRVNARRAEIRESLARELAALDDGRGRPTPAADTELGRPQTPADGARAHARELEAELDSILERYSAAQSRERRPHEGERAQRPLWSAWWHLRLPGGGGGRSD